MWLGVWWWRHWPLYCAHLTWWCQLSSWCGGLGDSQRNEGWHCVHTMSLHTSFWHFQCSADLQPPGLMIINVTVQTVPSVTHTHEHTLNTICSIRTPLVGKHTIKVRVTIVYYVECTVSSRKLSRLARSTLSSNCICSACIVWTYFDVTHHLTLVCTKAMYAFSSLIPRVS